MVLSAPVIFSGYVSRVGLDDPIILLLQHRCDQACLTTVSRVAVLDIWSNPRIQSDISLSAVNVVPDEIMNVLLAFYAIAFCLQRDVRYTYTKPMWLFLTSLWSGCRRRGKALSFVRGVAALSTDQKPNLTLVLDGPPSGSLWMGASRRLEMALSAFCHAQR